ncbi:MAG: hypothetical protein WCH04_16305 [Gammaproteobacteria bacterium]|jgi:hypothetical protein
MATIKETIPVEFHLDEEGNVVDVTSPHGKHSKDAPMPPHAWASAVVTTKHSPGCFYVWIAGGWVKICT